MSDAAPPRRRRTQPTTLRGLALIHDPRLNKGTAFTQRERDTLGLQGLLPPRVLTMDEQLLRVRRNFDVKPSDLEKYIFLVGLQDRNETLFYRLLVTHLPEMMPIVYTPTVGEACRAFGSIFRRPRGLYISLRDRGRVDQVLGNWPAQQVAVIVVTDGERILGLGDLGAHGMGIPIGKLALYTACAGVPPDRCLPVLLDVGTDNAPLREGPLYTGLREPRARGGAYDALIEEFVSAVERRWPGALVQWEDFATANAVRLLARYRDRLCTFNDDIQGTAAVVLSALYSACRATGRALREQRLLFLGAGAAALGVAGLVTSALAESGLSDAEARARIGLMDVEGLVVASRTDLSEHQRVYALPRAPERDLATAVRDLAPTVLVGLSTSGGAFTEHVVRAMAGVNERPVILALSNPTSNAECTAEQAYRWTDGRALFAGGSPFAPVTVGGRLLRPGQANNAFIFPGLGLGVTLSGAQRVSDAMFHAAAVAVAEAVTDDDLAHGGLLPPLERLRDISATIAARVAAVAARDGLARTAVPADGERWVREQMYQPDYAEYVPA